MTPGGASPFLLFGTAHVLTMLLTGIAAIAFPLFVQARVAPVRWHTIGTVIGISLVTQELLKTGALVWWYDVPLQRSLPLQLCGVETFLVAYLLVKRSFAAFEVAYFWGLAGTAQAIVTPDLAEGFPSPTYLVFFLGHGLVIVGILYAVIVFRFRPTLRSVWKAVSATLAYLGCIAVLNLALDTNYFYLRHKPNEASLMDYFGPWPWYIVTGIMVGAVFYLVCYLPFAVHGRQSLAPVAAPAGRAGGRSR